jgi:hypothetical protein
MNKSPQHLTFRKHVLSCVRFSSISGRIPIGGPHRIWDSGSRPLVKSLHNVIEIISKRGQSTGYLKLTMK